MTMQSTLQVLHLIAGLVVLMEALNKLERVALFATGLTSRQRWADGLKALAWGLLALGAAGALAGPWLQPMGEYLGATRIFAHITQPAPSLADVCALGGFAVLIVRTRIKEG